MLVTFIGAIACAVLAACVAFIVRRIWGVQMRWLIPAAAGAAMLGFTIWNDYSWYGRQLSGLPPGVVVVEAYESKGALQPWTLVAPVIDRYSAVDLRGAQRRADDPEILRAPFFIAQRYQPSFVSPQIIDCRRGRRADAADAGADGLPPDAAWFALEPGHPLLRAACAAGEG